MQELRINTTHPLLAHTLRQEESSVLSLAADSRHIFSGSQGKDIYVWDRETMQVTKTLHGHSASVLMLELSEEKEWLFSSSSDSTVRIWSTSSLSPLYVIHPHGETDAGDIYSLAFSYTPLDPSSSSSAEKAILFIGCQNTSLQWIDLSSIKLCAPTSNLTAAPVTGDAPRQPPARLTAVTGSTTESSSDFELEYELEFEFEGEDEDGFDQTLEDADDELSHAQDERTPTSAPNPSAMRTRLNAPRRQSSRPPKKPHKFFDSQPRGSQNRVPTLSTSPSSSVVNDPHSHPIPRNASFSSIGSIERPGSSSLNPANDPAAAARQDVTPTNSKPAGKRPCRPRVLRVPSTNVIDSAHYGYIYCMTLVPAPVEEAQIRPFGEYEPEVRYPSDCNARADGEIRFVSGSGDEDVKVWSFSPNTPSPTPILLKTFRLPASSNPCSASEGCGGAVLSVMVRNNCIYAGCQDGLVVVWSLDTSSVVRTILTKDNVDVLSLSLVDTDLYTCLSDGEVQRWSGSFSRTAVWKAHDGIVLSSIVVPSQPPASSSSGGSVPAWANGDGAKQRWVLVTGANDNHIKLWIIEPPPKLTSTNADEITIEAVQNSVIQTDAEVKGETPHSLEPTSRSLLGRGVSNETMVQALTEFVGIPSVTASETHREFCRQAAIWLQASLSQLGAEAFLLPSVVEGKNPLVLGTFHSTSKSLERRPRVLFYGHYDVIAAPTSQASSSWRTQPFDLTGVNGYLYGRGVTDNKGPIIASACAVASLLARRELDCDVVFLVEGEEEAGSGGFADSVRAYKDRIGHIDAILLSNSYWIDETTPCITYGLRGVVQASLEISSQYSDLHSGVEGGAWNEPMMDMIKLLATLSGQDSKIAIPSFYDAVRSETASEASSYVNIAQLTGSQPSKIASRWREPSLTVHNMTVSGSNNPTVIPSSVKAQVSVRIVPDQDLQTITDALQNYIRSQFNSFGTTNTLKITIDRTADWWLGQLDDEWFHALEKSVRDEWGVQPLQIREGGSIPSIPFLEKEFGCHALHLPMGQSSDQAHLQNERISLNNLYKGRSVVERFFRLISAPNFVHSP